MQKPLIISVCLLILHTTVFAQTKPEEYSTRWRQVDSLAAKGFPKSALTALQNIYDLAKKEGNGPQRIKALVYRLTLEDNQRDTSFLYNIKVLQKEMQMANDPSRSILQSLLAETYEDYLQQHRWQLYGRTNVAATYKNDDVATWTLADFHRVISEHYLESLRNEILLKRTRLDYLDPLIKTGTQRNLRPTLYDLLAHRAIEYFSSDERNIDNPAYAFKIDDTAIFASPRVFAQYKFETKDSLSLYHKAILLYQQLTAMHVGDANPSALIDLTIARLRFAERFGVMEGKEELYLDALQTLAEQYADNGQSGYAWYLIAEEYASKARSYNDSRSDPKDRYGYVKAKAICEKVLAKNDSSWGAESCRILLKEINRKEVSVTTEKVNVPGKPFRMLVNYRNFNQLHFRLIKVDDGFTANSLLKKYADTSFWKKVAKLAYIKTFSQALPETNDHFNHSVEIKIDALPAGRYALLASVNDKFDEEENLLALQEFHVSNIAYIHNGSDIFVLHRETGQPLAGATVNVYTAGMELDKKTYTADRNGHLNIANSKNQKQGRNGRQVMLTIKYGNDVLDNDESFDTHRDFRGYDDEDDEDYEDSDRQEYEEDHLKVYLFSDRAIYRPGQTVFFKGIVVTKDFKTRKWKVVPRFKTTVYLNDANDDDVDSLDLVTNEFGSYSGKFRLPEGRMNGEFDLWDIEADGELSFQVEEYKRPKFYLEAEKTSKLYRLNDSIALDVFAKAYAGDDIGGATVKYTVERSSVGRWAGYYTGQQQISHGETTTNNEGKFVVNFKLLPDVSVPRSSDPIFSFEVKYDVTDINGETRSGTETIQASYKALKVSIDLPGTTMEADSLKKIFVKTTNYADKFYSARVNVGIYKLDAPQRLIRRRYWSQPDQFIMSKEEYLKYFPNDQYSDETKRDTWKKLEKVYERSDSTKASGIFNLGFNFKPGWYLIEAITVDAYGDTSKETKYIQLVKQGRPASPSYAWHLSNQVYTVNPGEKISVDIGSSASDVFVIQEIKKIVERKKGRSIASSNYNYTSLNNGQRLIDFTGEEESYGVFYAFIKDNRFYVMSNNITLSTDKNQLQISYETYRDKTLPGSNEKWKVKISGPGNEQMAAEMLTSMYDASLDQFKKQEWNGFESSVARINSDWNAADNFKQESALIIEEPRWYEYRQRTYDKILTAQDVVRHIHAMTRNPSYMMFAGKVSGISISNEKMEEVTVVGYSGKGKKSMSYSTASIRIRGNSSVNNNALVVVDGVIYEGQLGDLNPADIESASVLKGEEATAIWGARAKEGVIVITTKEGANITANAGVKKKTEQVQLRKNFNETAFFFPDLCTGEDGSIEFSFTMPEALTKWKWMIFSHSKAVQSAYSERFIVTQKELMVQPNVPRFVREGDRMDLSAKIVNMGSKEVSGQIEMQLLDATTNQPVDGWFNNMFPNQYFTAEAGQSTLTKFTVQIPFQYNKPLVVRFIAKAGNVSDGEENTIPVLSNKLLVTETLPLNIRGTNSKNFTFDKLLKSDSSETLSHHALTIEFTSNPAWYAVQALPYLMEFPHECSEQTWNRIYANMLAAKIANASPRIKQIFEKWKTTDTAALLSNLEKNQELKSVLLQETPWVMEAKSESEQKKRIALLFDMVKLTTETEKNIEKLMQQQLSNGAFPWFKGGMEDRYITQYIVTGIGHLKKLNAVPASVSAKIDSIAAKAIPYLDRMMKEDYVRARARKYLYVDHIQTNYLYMRSFFSNIKMDTAVKTAFDHYISRSTASWTQLGRYMQAMTALIMHRNGDSVTASNIIRSLKENAIMHDELGMYWKDVNGGYYWYQSAIETQALLIEAFTEISKDLTSADAMKTWLLKNKQTNNWNTTKSTAEAVYALLLQGTDWLSSEPIVQLKLGDKTVSSRDAKPEAGTGYFKKVFDAPFVNKSMGNISVNITRPNGTQSQTAWGAVYWQYFENLENITPAATPLKLSKKLFVERNTDRGPLLEPVENNAILKTGDKIKVRIELKVDRDMEYVHMKDMRAASLEPVNVISEYKWQDGLGYYESTKDASTNFFFSYLPKGTYVFEYALFVTHTGTFSNGITTIQCMYAPEFSSHSAGVKINVE